MKAEWLAPEVKELDTKMTENYFSPGSGSDTYVPGLQDDLNDAIDAKDFTLAQKILNMLELFSAAGSDPTAP